MMRLIISGFAVVVLIVVAATVLGSRFPSIEVPAATAAMPALQELHTMAGVHKLPIQEIEDQSLVYPTTAKR
jgi:hypothetical protein